MHPLQYVYCHTDKRKSDHQDDQVARLFYLLSEHLPVPFFRTKFGDYPR